VNVAEGDDLIIFIDGDGRLDMEAHPLIGGTGRFAWWQPLRRHRRGR
jgi:hypothetical protein